MIELDALRYPVGKFVAPEKVSADQVEAWIDEIEGLPAKLRALVEPMTPAQLETPYRPGGWRVRQVVHHLGDSHLNSYIRFKWTLTEERPVIKPYYEDRWAQLAEYAGSPLKESLEFLEVLHARWVRLLRGLSGDDLRREFVHPESGPTRLDVNIGIYAWHGRHHMAHITGLAEREGWGT